MLHRTDISFSRSALVLLVIAAMNATMFAQGSGAAASRGFKADMVVLNANIHTMDPKQPRARA
ncbi:MAG TPA: hypothetical protein PKE66_07650, partial [Pyrinomonadaceae bacterium]|nr:hypothetical protein [Pyrinomonadaceae bacterium]